MKKLNKTNIFKSVLGGIVFAIMIFNSVDVANASDYKYKVLDPKYNPEAEQLINGTLPPERTMYVEKKENFDLGTFLAIFALVTFPFGIIYIAMKTFKDVMKEPEEEQEKENNDEQVIGNIKINKDSEDSTSENKEENEEDYSFGQKLFQYNEKIESKKTETQTNTKEIPNTFVKKYGNTSNPIEQIPNPRLLYTSPLSSNKGFCLVQYNHKYSLIGYINDEIFLLNQFDNINSKEIRARLSETKKSGERYIVKLDDYKALVEVSNTKIDILTNI